MIQSTHNIERQEDIQYETLTHLHTYLYISELGIDYGENLRPQTHLLCSRDAPIATAVLEMPE